MDIALSVEKIILAPQYNGSVTANTQEAWDKVIWQDERRAKPTWTELEAAWTEYVTQEAASQRLAAIDVRLAEIDAASTRPIRALLDGSGTDDDRTKLAELERESEALREERKGLAG